MAQLQFNKDYMVIGDVNQQEVLLLKHKATHRVFKMSNTEYKILKWFGDGHSAESIKSYLFDEFDVTDEVLREIIASGAKLGLLVERENVVITNSRDLKPVSRIRYIFYLILKFLNVNPERLKLDSSSSFNLVKLLKWHPKPLTLYHYKILLYALATLVIVVYVFIYFSSELFINWSNIFYQLSQLNIIHILFIALPISLIISLMHELSHYIVYKYYGGIQNEIGFGLLYRVVPIFYTTTEDIIIWKSKSKKIQVAFAGIINDLLFLAIFSQFINFFDDGLFRSISCFILFSLIIKLVYNSNPFSPGSDMYFILIDILNEKISFSKLHEKIKLILKGNKISNIGYLELLYVILCYLSIAFYFTAFITMVTFPIWINFVV